MGEADGGTPEILGVLNAAIYGIIVAFILFLIARLFAERRPATTWEAANIKLPVKRWYFVMLVLGAIALLDRPIYREISRLWLEASIETADPNRLSVVIPDFEGQGGVEAADIVQTMLQSSLGSGVQIIRRPALGSGSKYGDAGKKVDTLGAESLFCAAKYKADVVVWGTNHPGSRKIGVNYTVKEPECYPSNCGVVPSRYPKLYNLGDAQNARSQLAKNLSESVVTALGLATRRGDEPGTVRAAQCLGNPDTARRFAAKADALLDGNPEGLSGDTADAAAGYAATFHQKNFEHSRDPHELDRAIALLEGSAARRPAETFRTAGFRAMLMFDRGEISQDPALVLKLADRTAGLLKYALPADRDLIAERADGLLEMAFYLSPRPDLLARVEASYQTKLRARGISPAGKLHAIIRIAAIRAAFMADAPSLERHTSAVKYDQLAFSLLPTPNNGLDKVLIQDRCALARADLILTNVHRDPQSLVQGFNRATVLVNERFVDWNDSNCTAAFHEASRNLQLLSELAPGDAPALLRLAVRLERSASSNDRTQRPEYNRAHLAVASAKLALASGKEEDRQAALKLVRLARQDGMRLRDDIEQRSMTGFIAQLEAAKPR